MTQVSKYPLREDVYNQILDIFFGTIAKLGSKKEVKDFFADFLTPTEKIMLTKRLAIFVMLAKGYDYQTIRETLRVSPPTIASANTYYKYLGKGCKKVVEKIIQDEKMKEFWENIAEKITGTLASSRKGGGVWRYLHQEVRRQKRKKAF